MILLDQEFAHPTQASSVRLTVYEEPGTGWLVTETHGVTLAAKAGTLMLPRRYRDEALAPIGQGAKVLLAKRYAALTAEDKQTVLGIAWAAALYEDPSVARRALLRARHDRVAQDLADDGNKARHGVEDWIYEVLAPAAFPMGAE